MTTKRALTPFSGAGPLNWGLGRHETGGAAVLQKAPRPRILPSMGRI